MVPVPVIWPSSRTAMRSAESMVESPWAMIRALRPAMIPDIAAATTRSVSRPGSRPVRRGRASVSRAGESEALALPRRNAGCRVHRRCGVAVKRGGDEAVRAGRLGSLFEVVVGVSGRAGAGFSDGAVEQVAVLRHEG